MTILMAKSVSPLVQRRACQTRSAMGDFKRASLPFRHPAVRIVLATVLLANSLASWQIARADEPSVEATHGNLEASKDSETSPEVRDASEKPATTRERRVKPETAISALPKISAEREAEILRFAQDHHPELASVLQRLKSQESIEEQRPQPSEPQTSASSDISIVGAKRRSGNDKSVGQYQAALADLDRVVERLGRLKGKSPEKYEAQLEEWKNSSRLRLVGARLAMKDDPAVEKELKAILGDRIKIRLAAQQLMRDRLQKRLEKLNQSIDEMSSDSDALIEKQLADLRKTLAGSKSSTKSRAKKSTASEASSVRDENH